MRLAFSTIGHIRHAKVRAGENAGAFSQKMARMVKEMKTSKITIAVVALIAVCISAYVPHAGATALPLQQPYSVQDAGSATAVSACPSGCECLTDAAAAAKFGAYARCSNAVCGYEPVTVSARAPEEKAPYPKYCVRKIEQATPVPVCPANCACLPEQDAKEKGYVLCGGMQKICGYQSLTGTSAETSTTRPLYCYSRPVQSACPVGCDCMTEAQAKEKFGTYERCSNTPCTNAPVASAAQATYCFKKAVEPAGTPYVRPVDCTCTCKSGTNAADVILPTCTCTCAKCIYDDTTSRCTGSCGNPGEACQINTVVNNPDGSVAYAECHCKQTATVVLQPAATPYVIAASCDSVTGMCRSAEGSEMKPVSIKADGQVKAREEQEIQTQAGQESGGQSGSGSGVVAPSPQKVAVENTAQVRERNEAQGSTDIVRSISAIIRSFFGLNESG
jgi:hypothetical protein